MNENRVQTSHNKLHGKGKLTVYELQHAQEIPLTTRDHPPQTPQGVVSNPHKTFDIPKPPLSYSVST